MTPVELVPANPIFRSGSRPAANFDRASHTFNFGGVAPGRYFVRTFVTGLPGGRVESITADGRDVTDAPLELGTKDVSDLVITVSTRSATVNGVVHGLDGAIDGDATVFFFPSDRTRWPDARGSTIAFQSVRSSKAGTFTISNPPAGDYLVVSAHDDPGLDWLDRASLARLAALATAVHVSAGEQQSVTLKTVTVK
jgi:hypothetical protein